MERVRLDNQSAGTPMVQGRPTRYLQVSANQRISFETGKRNYVTFSFSLTSRKSKIGDLDYWLINGKVVAVKKLPAYLSKMAVPKMACQNIGYIGYSLERQCATTIACYPKNDMANYPPEYSEGASGFGYLAELAATVLLEKTGARFVLSPDDSNNDTSGDRTAQLSKVGLPAGIWADIGKWKKGMAAGVKRKSRNFFRITQMVETNAV